VFNFDVRKKIQEWKKAVISCSSYLLTKKKEEPIHTAFFRDLEYMRGNKIKV